MRAGFDVLGGAMCLVAALLLMFSSPYTVLPAAALMGIALWRALSSRISAREEEDALFIGFLRRALRGLRPLGWRLADALRGAWFSLREFCAYKTFACPVCRLRQRVPRGRGRVRIRCRKCGTSFEGKA